MAKFYLIVITIFFLKAEKEKENYTVRLSFDFIKILIANLRLSGGKKTQESMIIRKEGFFFFFFG